MTTLKDLREIDDAHPNGHIVGDAGANPPDATRHCCGDSSDCAGAASDPVELAAARRVEIETARNELEAAAMECLEAASFNNTRIGPVSRLAYAARRLRELRKGTT